MVTKSIKLDEKIIKDLELVAKGLNEKSGVDVYNFSSVLRAAIDYYLSSDHIQEIVKNIRRADPDQKDLLLASESSLSKDWLKPQEDEAWANL